MRVIWGETCYALGQASPLLQAACWQPGGPGKGYKSQFPILSLGPGLMVKSCPTHVPTAVLDPNDVWVLSQGDDSLHGQVQAGVGRDTVQHHRDGGCITNLQASRQISVAGVGWRYIGCLCPAAPAGVAGRHWMAHLCVVMDEGSSGHGPSVIAGCHNQRHVSPCLCHADCQLDGGLSGWGGGKGLR